MEPWYRTTHNYDRHRLAQMQAEIDGVAFTSGNDEWNRTRALQAHSLGDGDLLRAYLEIALALRRADQVLADPVVDGRLPTAPPAKAPPRPGGPSRDELVAALG
jgi:hypothetical protein